MKHNAPVSRFWACFFAGSIFALFWTLKMKKTRRWLVVSLLSIPINMLIAYAAGEGYYAAEWTISHYYMLGVDLGFLALVIYLMYGWSTAYNMEKFGCSSRGQWNGAPPAGA
ncbi:hypothetical protein CENSYa_0505 [Cenarchaeum symbiosum A]|uniref:Uncharacterized protein n=1 Tax=Cenarchaeum symbiosum (strain A) TaxID=414004 RepID=A0RUX1_CENSY|nr:hypothetical protein CENSYa_0505 [Cenarchaeum symbiosum A]